MIPVDRKSSVPVGTIAVAFIGWAGACAYLRQIYGIGRVYSVVSDSQVSLVQEDEFALPPWKPGSEEEHLAQRNPEMYPHNEDTFVSQVTWLHSCLTSPVGSSSTPSSTWVLSVCSRCSSQTLHSCKASCSSASSQVSGQRKQRTLCLAPAGAGFMLPLASIGLGEGFQPLRACFLHTLGMLVELVLA